MWYLVEERVCKIMVTVADTIAAVAVAVAVADDPVTQPIMSVALVEGTIITPRSGTGASGVRSSMISKKKAICGKHS